MNISDSISDETNASKEIDRIDEGEKDEMYNADNSTSNYQGPAHSTNPATESPSSPASTAMDLQQPYTDTQSEVNPDSEMSSQEHLHGKETRPSWSNNHHPEHQNAHQQYTQHEMLLKFYQARMSECAAAYASAAAGAAWAASALIAHPPDFTLVSTTPVANVMIPPHPPPLFMPFTVPPYPYPQHMATPNHFMYSHPPDPTMVPVPYYSSNYFGDASMAQAFPLSSPYEYHNNTWDGEVEMNEVPQDGGSEGSKAFQTTKKLKRAVNNFVRGPHSKALNTASTQESNMNVEPNHDDHLNTSPSQSGHHNTHSHYTHKQHTKKTKSLNHEVYDTASNVMYPKKTKKSIFQQDSTISHVGQKDSATLSIPEPLQNTPKSFYPTNQYGMYPHIQKPFNPKGKSAISALFELCNKRKWDPPRFVEISSLSINSTIATSMAFTGEDTEIVDDGDHPSISTCSNPIKTKEYIYSVYLNQRDMGRGRGGTKKAAQQDAARKALTAIFPHMTFNDSGMIVDVGYHGVKDFSKTRNSISSYHSSDVPEDITVSASNSKILEEHLAPKLASRLAINATTVPMKPKVDDALSKLESPPTTVFVESSKTKLFLSNKNCLIDPIPSDRTSVGNNQLQGNYIQAKSADQNFNISKNAINQEEDVIPFDLQVNGGRSSSEINISLIDPSASTLSGISSVSDEDDYYASRGASICSALLHAISQIHSRIKDPPEFLYHTIPLESSSTTLLTSCEMTTDKKHRHNKQTTVESPKQFESWLDKGLDENNTELDYAVSHPLYPDDELESSRMTQHRLSFSCTASVNVSGPNDDRGLELGDFEDTGTSIALEAIPELQHTETKKLCAIGTGPTKRDAKHVASAKLLSLLFPQCHGILEVIRAAEDVRERHAASRAAVRQSKRLSAHTH